MANLLAIGASTSSKSINRAFASYAASHVESDEVIAIDLNEFEMPIYSADREEEGGIPDAAKAFVETIAAGDAIVLSLAFAIGATTRSLGTGVFVAQAAQATVNPGFVPAIVFLLACFIAFSTGTSWGTFAIMIPIVIPMVDLIGLHPGLALAAALGGGIFGDHCSPISDSTIVASMAAATDHIDHVRTQLPYSLTAAGAAAALFLIFGFVL